MAKELCHWGCLGERALQILPLTASCFRTEPPSPPRPPPSNSPPVFSWEGLNRISLWEP